MIFYAIHQEVQRLAGMSGTCLEMSGTCLEMSGARPGCPAPGMPGTCLEMSGARPGCPAPGMPGTWDVRHLP